MQYHDPLCAYVGIRIIQTFLRSLGGGWLQVFGLLSMDEMGLEIEICGYKVPWYVAQYLVSMSPSAILPALRMFGRRSVKFDRLPEQLPGERKRRFSQVELYLGINVPEALHDVYEIPRFENGNKMSECIAITNFTPEEIRDIIRVFRIQPTIQIGNSRKVSDIVAFSMMCNYLKGVRHSTAAILFHIDPASLCGVVWLLIDKLGEKASIFLDPTTHPNRVQIFENRIAHWVEAFKRRSGVEDIEFWGMLDGTDFLVSRPSHYKLFEITEQNVTQDPFYDGHHKVHSMACLAVVAADGLMYYVSEWQPGRTPDVSMQTTVSNLESIHVWRDEYEGIRVTYNASRDHVVPGAKSTIYAFGDNGFVFTSRVCRYFSANDLRLNPNLNNFNKVLRGQRVSIENCFAKVGNLWRIVKNPRMNQVFRKGLCNKFNLIIVLTNIHTILNGSQVTNYFGCYPPTLEQYVVG